MVVSRRLLWVTAACGLGIVLPTLLSEVTVYKLGLVLILFVGAIGLHVLVNWTGELSLAHAALVGLPAFAVAKVSADHSLSPVLLLPLGLLVGLVAGVVIGLPAIRARGLQVALVTLAAGVAIDRFFFTKAWLVGTGAGADVALPTLGPIRFASARALYPLLAVLVIGWVLVAWCLQRSKVGRALLWIKAQPDAAAAFGVPVALYRTAAYGLAGAYAGFSGGLTAMWVQHLTPAAFPPAKSFTYLIVVALAGPGFVAGLALAATVVEGGRLFLPNADALLAYGAPVGLLFTLTKYRTGLNGMLRALRTRVGARRKEFVMPIRVRGLVVFGGLVAATGFVAIGLAWYHAGNTSQVWIQNQELISGGVGGLALVVFGAALIVVDQIIQWRSAEAARFEHLLAALEPPAKPKPVRRSAKSAA